MSKRWTQLIRNGQDANLGAALIRLTQQAVAVHQYEAAREAIADRPAPGSFFGDEVEVTRDLEPTEARR